MGNSQPLTAVTLAEVAAIVRRLDRRPCSAAQARAVLVVDTKGRARPVDVRPDGVAVFARQGETRLYAAVDVAMVRLWLRLRKQGISPAVARVLLDTRRDDLAEVWAHDEPMALAVIGFRALLLFEGGERPSAAAAWVPLRPVWADIESEIARTRKAEPQVWQWKPVRPVEAVRAS